LKKELSAFEEHDTVAFVVVVVVVVGSVVEVLAYL